MTPLNSSESLLDNQAPASPLWTVNFILLLAANFIIYSNIAIFFNFYGYLTTLPIDPAKFGLLIGFYSAVSLAFRPLVSPFFNAGNARPFIFLGTLLVMLALASYSLASGFWNMLLVRGFHGLAFVVLGAALLALTVEYIPQDRSSQAFGVISIVAVLPTTVIPPLFPIIEKAAGGFNQVMLVFAGLTALAFPLIMAVKVDVEDESAAKRPGRLSRKEVFEDLRDHRILITFLSMLMLYLGNALIFFFIVAYAAGLGVTGAGLFFTVSTLAELGVRAAAGSSFDKMKKTRLIAVIMLGLALCYVILALGSNKLLFFGVMGAFIGLGWGIALPVFNGLVFDMSEPKYRAMNTNLGVQMYQLGYFIGPMIGGWMVEAFGFSLMFVLCAGLSVLGGALILFVKNPKIDKSKAAPQLLSFKSGKGIM